MTTFVIERDKVIHNTGIIKKYAGNRRIYAVLKGNAYGLGLIPMANILYEQGINHFAVTEPEDALILKELFPNAEVLLMTPVYMKEAQLTLIRNRVTLTISSTENADTIAALCIQYALTAIAHIEVDTGMGRYGFLPQDARAIEGVYDMPGIKVTGIYTHIYGCGRKKACTRGQVENFRRILARLKTAGIDPGTAHVANSVTLFKYSDVVFDAVRVGSAFTGRLSGKNKYGLQKVGHVEAEVGEIRVFPKGHNIGYGGVCKTKRDTRAAIIPVGYAQYFCVNRIREVSRFWDMLHYILADVKRFVKRQHPTVTIRGKNLPILGHVGMNHTVVDLMDVACDIGERVCIEINPILCGTMLQRKYI